MNYLILFIEGIITFISPCILPMIPIYISYFMGGDVHNSNKKKAIINSLGFVLGFSIIFTTLGAAAGAFGRFIYANMNLFNYISGSILILFGLNYIGILNIKFLQRTFKLKGNTKNLNILSSITFGAIFAIGWTPCVGTFLGSALMIASNSQDTFKGILMLLVYSLGLGIPFVVSAILIDSLKGVFTFIKQNYKTINIISGVFLIIIGIFMITGYLNTILSFLTF